MYVCVLCACLELVDPQRKALGFLEQMFLSHQAVLGIKSGSSGRLASTINPAPTPFIFKCSVAFLCLIHINYHFPANWVFFHWQLWGAGIYYVIFWVKLGMLFCLSEELISFFGVQCPHLSSSWESPLYFPQRRRRGVMSQHTDEHGSCKVQNSICSNGRLTGTRLRQESLLHSTEIRGFSRGRQALAWNLLASTCFSLFGMLCPA